MKLRTRIFLWYSGALLAAMLVLLAHGAYEVYEHTNEKKPAFGSEFIPEDPTGDWHEVKEVIAVELLFGVPLLVLGMVLTWWFTRGTLDKLQSLTDAAAGLHAGNLEIDLPSRAPVRDELDRLIEVFREMVRRLNDSFAQTRDFTLNASHELKTPLAIMRGEVETELRAAPPEPERRAWMESMLEEIDRLARVVDGLTFLAKVDAGQIPLKMEPVDLAELVRDAVGDARSLADPHDLIVSATIPDGPSMIRGDRHRLRQLLLNLADNAVKYNAVNGSVGISLVQEHESAVLIFTNPGPGIPADVADRVFERFFRAPSHHRHPTEGSGLGLNIARWIVKSHGGDISVRTGSDSLTRATVRLPRHT